MATESEPTTNKLVEDNKVDMPKRNLIIVTGNGFDRNCRLATRYCDFMTYLIHENFNSINDEFSIILASRDYDLIRKHYLSTTLTTIWEYYFYTEFASVQNSPDPLWFDIENKMVESFQIDGFWDNVKKILVDTIPADPNEVYKFPEPKTRESVAAEVLYHSHPTKFFNSVNHEFKPNGFYNSLFSELNKFEKKFGKYLGTLNLKSDSYKNDKKSLFDKIINAAKTKIGGVSDAKFLTFNYTSVSDIYTLNYVHGTIENPIFGISDDNAEDDIKRFTKQSRRNAIHKFPTYADILEEGKHYSVAFYGTSFADSDTSDYEIILSYVNFDKGDKIIVCYSNYGGVDRYNETRDSFRAMYSKIRPEVDFDILMQNNQIMFSEID